MYVEPINFKLFADSADSLLSLFLTFSRLELRFFNRIFLCFSQNQNWLTLINTDSHKFPKVAATPPHSIIFDIFKTPAFKKYIALDGSHQFPKAAIRWLFEFCMFWLNSFVLWGNSWVNLTAEVFQQFSFTHIVQSHQFWGCDWSGKKYTFLEEWPP